MKPRVRNVRRTVPSIEVVEARRLLATLIVNSLGDDNVGTGDVGDLRYVLNRANALKSSTPDTIVFSGVTISASNHTIRVGQGAAGRIPLPAITDPVIIDATTAKGFDNLAGLMVQIDGSGLRAGANGLVLQGGNSTVRALQITSFPANGILVTSGSNTIGGKQIGVDANGNLNNPAGKITSPPSQAGPTPRVIVRPPQGNVIAGNGGDGIRVSGPAATNNVLNGNFVGTTVAGTTAVPNKGNGVSLLNANGTQITGTDAPDGNNPFVYYNVISGNNGNGLLINNSNNTIIYANFFGLGADDATPLGNKLNGVLVNGNSDSTRFGANIPLGNVSAANGKNGLEIAGHASRTLAGNTFAGIAAFNPNVSVGNKGNGILITSDGGGRTYNGSRFTTIILTCQVAGNGGDGIQISGNARRVQVSQSIVGLDTNGDAAVPNRRNGINVTGHASEIAIGGFEPSVAGEPPNNSFLEASSVVSGNLGNGIVVSGHGVKNVKIVNTVIGLNTSQATLIGNRGDGIVINRVNNVRIGSRVGTNDPKNRLIIAGNGGSGINVQKSEGVSILGNSVFANGGPGIVLGKHANDNQPSPTLTFATVAPVTGLTQVRGTISGEENTIYQLEIFSSTLGTGGNGRNFLGFIKVRTNSEGVGQFNLAGLSNPTGARFLTATATSPEGNTSPFSKAIQAIS